MNIFLEEKSKLLAYQQAISILDTQEEKDKVGFLFN